MAHPPLLFNPDYSFVDVPGAGYAVTISPLTFGFVGQERKPDVALFLRDESRKADLEHILSTEASKPTWKVLLSGIGDNSRFYPPSAAILFGICSAPFVCPIHLALFAFVGVPFFAVPRYLQKKSVGKMTTWLADATVYEMNGRPLIDYVTKEGIDEKIQKYSEAKHQLGFIAQVKALVSEPEDLRRQRQELAKNFGELHALSIKTLFSVPANQKYPLIVAHKTYNFVRNAYEGRWFKQQEHVLFSPVTDCCHK
ncbi:hypothetical protein HY639_02370 [Candidatus Woesearchaeota archaeon]|nr:hypothetical protein [Candidatus Woesearchaeota archaeon]